MGLVFSWLSLKLHQSNGNKGFPIYLITYGNSARMERSSGEAMTFSLTSFRYRTVSHRLNLIIIGSKQMDDDYHNADGLMKSSWILFNHALRNLRLEPEIYINRTRKPFGSSTTKLSQSLLRTTFTINSLSPPIPVLQHQSANMQFPTAIATIVSFLAVASASPIEERQGQQHLFYSKALPDSNFSSRWSNLRYPDLLECRRLHWHC